MQPNPILVEVWRGEVLESFHRGAVVVSNAAGDVLFSLGNRRQLCYPRSALKFIQVLPLLKSGAADHFEFTDEEIAIMCGSHNGEPRHVELVESILKKIGLDASYLQCGPQMPTLKSDQEAITQNGGKPQAIHNNCSGKHAGFLAYAVYRKLPLANYLDPHHPMQEETALLSAHLHHAEADSVPCGMDGCSAPIFAYTVEAQARAFAHLADPDSLNDEALAKAIRRMAKAVQSYPFSVAGTGRYCTDMMKKLGQTVIGKTGAEGIFNMSFHKQGLGVCIKIDDGKMLPQYHVAQAFLRNTGLFSDADFAGLEMWDSPPIKNWNKKVTGHIQVAEGIFSELAAVCRAR